MTRLSVVIPAYNEEDRIVRTLEETTRFLSTKPYESEVVVVSDGSTDNTCQVATAHDSGRGVRVRALEYRPNRGKGYAVRHGMLRAKGEVCLFMDADYSVPMWCLDRGMALVENGADVAMASRQHPESDILTHQRFFRELSGQAYTLVQMFVLGLPYKDTQCGFKLFTKKAARLLFSRQRLSSVIFDPEILFLARRMGLTVAEFPVEWRHVGDSRIQYDSIGKSVFVFKELFRIRGLH